MHKLILTGTVLIISLAQMSCAGNLNMKDGSTDTELHASSHTVWYQFVRLWYND